MKSGERNGVVPGPGESRAGCPRASERRPAAPGLAAGWPPISRAVERSSAIQPACDFGRWVATVALVGLLAACASTGGGSGGKPYGARDGASAGAAASAGGSAGTRGAARGGGYYLDDGPGDAAPPDLDAIPDAVPRAEPVRETNSRPYSVFGREYRPMTRIEPYRQRGIASWYGRRYHGNATSSGERYDMYAMTAAHPTLPIPSYVRVTNLENQRSVVVRVNDRGPFLHDRLIDLSYTAAAKLGYVDRGSARVEVELITEFGESPATTTATAQQRSASGVAAVQSIAQPIAPPTAQSAAQSTAESAAFRFGTSAPERADAIAAASNQADAAQRSGGGATDASPERLNVSTEIRNADGAGQPRETDGAGQRRNADGAGQPAATASLSAATPVPALDRGYWLQLGAFGSAGNADAARERLSRQLTHLGAPIDVVADGGLFKLQAGPWPTQEAARAAADRVRAQAEVQAFSIRR